MTYEQSAIKQGKDARRMSNANYPIDSQASDLFANAPNYVSGYVPQYSTQQTDRSARRNQENVQEATLEQLDENERRRRGSAEYDRDLGNRQAVQRGYGINAARNAETARSLAVNAQNTLNSMYLDAGNRLNRASENTRGVLSDAANSIGNAFR